MPAELSSNMIWFYLILGVGTGIFSSVLGVGGGIIMVPALTLVALFPQKEAQGISLAVMIPMAIMSTIRYHWNPDITMDWRVIVIIGLAMIIGANIGSSLVSVLSNKTLKIIFALLLFITGARMIIVSLSNANGS